MAEEHDEHDEDITTEQYYKLAPGRSIFYDPSQENGKVVGKQVVKLEPTERVLLAFRSGHIETATEAAFKKYEDSVKKEAADRAAKATPAAAVVVTTAAPATVKEANTKAAQIIADAEKEATRIREQAETDAEQTRNAATTPQS